MTTRPAGPLVVLVLGASSGVGRVVARQLADRGEHVVLASRSRRTLIDAERECLVTATGSVQTKTVDIRDAAAVQALVDEVVEEHGRLDAVVQSAGVVAYGRFEEVPAEVFDGVIATNVAGAANVARSVLPVLRRQQHGSLVLIGSVLGEINVPLMSPYVVSKWALRSLARELALENRDLPDVHVSILSPGSVDTPIYRLGASTLERAARPPAPVDSAEKVATAVVRLVDHPRDRASVGVANPLMKAGFTFLPRVFDAVVGPAFAAAALTAQRISPTEGNVLEPVPDLEAVDGRFGQGLGTTAAGLVRVLRSRLRV